MAETPSGRRESARDAYIREIRAWRDRRGARLRAPDGWLSVTGLFWLEPGRNVVALDSGRRIVLSRERETDRLGSILLSETGASFEAEPGSEVLYAGRRVMALPLRADDEGQPTTLTRGTASFYLIRRGGRLALRVKDADSAARRDFRGIESFPIDSKWCLDARFEPYVPPRAIPVANVLGGEDSETSPGAIVFEIAGETLRLDPVLERGETDLFVIFADRTNGIETYGAGRFLYAPPPVRGRTVIDFNKAYNPPCVFTPFATCPLPPPQNRLAIRIEAGEKRYEER